MSDAICHPIVAFVYDPVLVSNVNVMFCVTAPAVSYEYIILGPPPEPKKIDRQNIITMDDTNPITLHAYGTRDPTI